MSKSNFDDQYTSIPVEIDIKAETIKLESHR
jgi:hypothetical protein